MTASATQKRLRALFREGGHEQVVAVAHEAARRGRAAQLPADLPAALREALLRPASSSCTATSGRPTTPCGPART